MQNSIVAFAIVPQPQENNSDLKCFLKSRGKPFFAFLILYQDISNLVHHCSLKCFK